MVHVAVAVDKYACRAYKGRVFIPLPKPYAKSVMQQLQNKQQQMLHEHVRKIIPCRNLLLVIGFGVWMMLKMITKKSNFMPV